MNPKKLEREKGALEMMRRELLQSSDSFGEDLEYLWSEAEHHWSIYERKYIGLKETAEESREDVGAALESLGEQIQEHYQKIKSSLKL